MWLKLFISVETFHVCSLLLLNTGCHPDTWTQNVLWTLNVYTWSHLQCRYVWTPDRKCFFPVKRTGRYQHVSLSLSFSDFIQMDSSDMLNLRAYIETACYYQPGAHVTKTKMETCVLWPWKSGVDPCVATASQWRLFAEVWINYIFCLNVVPGVTISSWTNQCPVLV